MSLKFLDHIRKTIGFRLTLLYSAIFIFSSLVLFILMYFFLLASIRKEDREFVRLKIKEYQARYETGGLDALNEDINADKRARRKYSLFVRVAGPQNETISLNGFDYSADVDLKELENRAINKNGQWIRLSVKGDEGVLEITSTRLRDGNFLQVGNSTQDREKILHRFRGLFASIMIPVIFIGFAGGAFLSFRALRPIRNLISAVRSIISTGRMDDRVPTPHTTDELDELVRLFNRMLEKIEALIMRMREALDHVAHDLRTPMTRLRGIAEMALQSKQSHVTSQEALADCLEESERVLTLLNTLMDISEAESGMLRLHLERVNVSVLVKNITELYRYVAEDNKVTISVKAPTDLPVTADRNRLQQVLANLLDNSIKYTPPGGAIEVEAHQNNHEVAITVKDNGVGIPPEDVPKIWDRLYRGDKSRSQRGLGLGLSLVKAIIEAHGGYTRVSSQLDAGSLFSVYLPATPVQN
ncbi:MAG: sensor histidine kinase [Candidatus Heimdallarchaeota archaeon]